MQYSLGDPALPLYLSFVTITTLGCGDIVPMTDASRPLASTQAFFGQTCIAIVIARLVGQYSSRRM